MKILIPVLIAASSALMIFPQSKSIETGLYLSIPHDSCSVHYNEHKIVYNEDTLCLEQSPVIKVSDIDSCFTVNANLDGNNLYVLNIKLNKTAVSNFKTATEQNVGKRMVMVIDNVAVMSAVIRDPVTTGRLTISGMKRQRLDELKSKLLKEMHKK